MPSPAPPRFDFVQVFLGFAETLFNRVEIFLGFGLTRRDPSDRPWLVARRSWLLPLRRHWDSAHVWPFSGSGPGRRSLLCTRTDRRWSARPSHSRAGK